MTKTALQRHLQKTLGPEMRVIARNGDVRIVHEKAGKQTVVGRGKDLRAAYVSLRAAAEEAAGASPASAGGAVRSSREAPRPVLPVLRLALHALWLALRMVFTRRRA